MSSRVDKELTQLKLYGIYLMSASVSFGVLYGLYELVRGVM
jgi:hypothetical protein